MHKDFERWGIEKKILEQKGPKALNFNRRDIWWCSLGINLGDEEDGKNEFFERPVIIIKKFNHRIAWVLPLTTKQKTGIYYYNFDYEGKVFSVLLSQIRLVSEDFVVL
jgi:mRNA interferase MazF